MINKIPRQVVSRIVSFGYGCAVAQYPGVYTRVSAFKFNYDNWVVNSDTITSTITPIVSVSTVPVVTLPTQSDVRSNSTSSKNMRKSTASSTVKREIILKKIIQISQL